MVFIVNDLHGDKTLTNETIKAISRMRQNDILIIKGDGAGARGPVMNNLIKVFYEVRRGETDEAMLFDAVGAIIGEKPEFPKEWVYDTVHGGLFRALLAERYKAFAECLEIELKNALKETLEPLSEAVSKRGVKLVYLPGNGEITPNDFSTEVYTKEIAVEPEKRFYQKLHREGFFEKYGIEYVPYVTEIGGRILISANALDLSIEEVSELLRQHVSEDDAFKTVIAHYPPEIEPVRGAFGFWTPNQTDIKRSGTLSSIVGRIKLDQNAKFYFGHIHLGVNDDRMMSYPAAMGFEAVGHECIWVKPGTVIRI